MPLVQGNSRVPQSNFSSVETAIDALARGSMVIVVDAEDRENEGDLVCAAEKVTPEIVNFMLVHGRGLICVPLLPEACARLNLEPLVKQPVSRLGTAFAMPVDHWSVKTGITAHERATTILALADPKSRPDDFLHAGHVFTLVAKEGGVLRRAGHTEAAVDLTRLSGLRPAGVICEILNDAGDRASRAELLDFARRFELPIITIEELIRFRRRSEKLVTRSAECDLPTRFGDFRLIAYDVKYEQQHPLVLIHGDLTSVEAPLVRLHSSCFTGDLLASLRCDCGDQLQMALQRIAAEGVGVLVYLPQEGRGIGLLEKLKAYQLQDQGLDTVEANLALGHKVDMRDYGIGIQLLKDLQLRRVRLLTNNPKKTDAFIYGGFDLQVVDQVPIVPPVNEHNARYLATKRDKLGHVLPDGIE